MTTEEEIELAVERQTDFIDATYLDGRLTDEEYDQRIAAIKAWAEARLAKLALGEPA